GGGAVRGDRDCVRPRGRAAGRLAEESVLVRGAPRRSTLCRRGADARRRAGRLRRVRLRTVICGGIRADAESADRPRAPAPAKDFSYSRGAPPPRADTLAA